MSEIQKFRTDLKDLFLQYDIDDIVTEKIYGTEKGISLTIGNRIAVSISASGWDFGDGFTPLTYVLSARKEDRS